LKSEHVDVPTFHQTHFLHKAGKGSWSTNQKFLQKKGGKNIPFLDETYLILKVGGGAENFQILGAAETSM
jgi:hypothetical protein